ncbi:MAG: aldehyde dehydrogenase family protein [Myxococcota bacterium]
MVAIFERPGDYIGGRFTVASDPDDEIVIHSPADLDDRVGVHDVSLDHVDRALEAARGAQPGWAAAGEAERRTLLRNYQDRLRANAEAITETLAREVGKPLWDARSEVGAMVGKVDLMLGEGAQWTADRRVENLPGEIRWRPHGVLAVIGPFNFPGHLPNGQIVPGLLLGNTVVFKPSEKTPHTAVWMARCFEEAGAPPGVFNVIQGRAPLAERLVTHDEVDGILFTGSVPVGKKIAAANADRPGRLIALELGGKNATLVLDDADLERTVRQVAFASYATAGQRCTATSRVYATRGIVDALTEALAETAASVVVGYPLDDGVFMGPLIDDPARRTLLEAQARALKAGFEPVVPGGAREVPDHRGHYVTPSVHRAPRADIHVPGYTHDELFGPDVAIYAVDDLDEAIALANGTRYGMVTSVFTGSAPSFEHAARSLRCGVVHWNRSSAGASGRLPFGGVKDSGNHRPAGILAGQLCAYPQAVQLAPTTEGPLPSWPGLGE